MSIIQQIREKYAAVGIGFIALSLIGFILMDSAKSNTGGMDPNDSIGEVNGRAFSYNEFTEKVRSIESMQEMNGRRVDDEFRQQIHAEVWRQMVERTLMENEYEKLGLVVSDKEFNDLLFGANPPQWLAQQFTDPNTGQFDVLEAKRAISEMKKSKGQGGNTEMLEQFYLDPMLEQALNQKYSALQRNSAYVPKFLVEKTVADNGSVASFRLVALPFAEVADSAINVTDEMVKAYINKNPAQYEQDEDMRSIAYVSFPYNPSMADTSRVLSDILSLKAGFDTTKNPAEYVARNGSIIPFADEYFSKARIQIGQKDSIIAAGMGKVYGPYIDGNAYVFSRVVDVKNRPDSVKARHILVSTYDMQTRQPIMSDTAAKAKIDSIHNLIKGGANFAALATALSDDKGSAEKGGDLGYFASGAMVKEFNDFCFSKTTGSSDVVKTQFGYHLIEITDQKDFAQAYKIAYLAKPIDASMETVNDALNAANVFAGNARDLKQFDDNVIKQGLNKLVAPDIRENEYNIMGLGVNRALVRDIFEAKVGTVLDPIDMKGQYIVIAIVSAEKRGLMSVQKARPMVEYQIKNDEKSKKILSELGEVTTLEALAQAKQSTVRQADSISFSSPMISGVGFEPKVVGYAFHKDVLNKVSKPIKGASGVYVISTASVFAASTLGTGAAEVKNTLLTQAKNVALSGSIDALKKRGDVVDKRSKFL